MEEFHFRIEHRPGVRHGNAEVGTLPQSPWLS